MVSRWLLLLPILATASCAAPASHGEADRLAKAGQETDCGMSFVLRRYVPRPGSGHLPVESGAAIPACTLPTDAEIEIACEAEESVPIPGTRSADNPDAPKRAFPDYIVQNAACTFADASRHSANCAFDLLGRPDGAERIDARLTQRFRDLSNEVAHPWLSVRWEVDAICTARR